VCRNVIAGANCGARKIHQVPHRQIFLTDLNPVNSGTHRILDTLCQSLFTIFPSRNVQRAAVGYVTKNEFVGCFQRSGTGILCRRRLPSQHSCGDQDIERAKAGNHAAHRGMKHERPKTRVVAQKIVSIPQAKPRQEQQNDSYLE
jgi:hypothetical protein